jgi:hypothetical protein
MPGTTQIYVVTHHTGADPLTIRAPSDELAALAILIAFGGAYGCTVEWAPGVPDVVLAPNLGSAGQMAALDELGVPPGRTTSERIDGFLHAHAAELATVCESALYASPRQRPALEDLFAELDADMGLEVRLRRIARYNEQVRGDGKNNLCLLLGTVARACRSMAAGTLRGGR